MSGRLRGLRSIVPVPLVEAVKKSAAKAGLYEPPVPHQGSAHFVLSRYLSFEGKRVLEIGGAQSAASMRPFIEDGAERGVVSGLDHVDQETKIDEKVSIVRADALRLSEVFGEESYDVIYGLSIIEHIPAPRTFLEELYRTLRPNGLAYLEGNPVWSSARGHHLWIATWGGPYQGRASANYLFNPYPGFPSSNPLPDWSHLLMSREEMGNYLAGERLPDGDIQCVLHWVYETDNINRLLMSEIAESYTTSRLVLLEANTRRSDVPGDVERDLRKRYGEGIDFGISGISYVLRKQP